MNCEYCGKVVTVGQVGSYKEVVAWVQERRGGGAHGVTDAKPTGRVFHEACWKLKKLDSAAASLF